LQERLRLFQKDILRIVRHIRCGQLPDLSPSSIRFLLAHRAKVSVDVGNRPFHVELGSVLAVRTFYVGYGPLCLRAFQCRRRSRKGRSFT
jgi:hypothetical protein